MQAFAVSVMFHVNVPDVLAYTVRLLRKAHAQGARTQVLLGTQSGPDLSAALWALPGTDFLAHAYWDDSIEAPLHPAIWLDARAATQVFCPVVVNLSEQTIQTSGDLQKLIEVVGTDEHARASARQRWRSYQNRGWTPKKYEPSA
jgi:DNA polymerase III subunit chi